MKLKANLKIGTLSYNEKIINISCDVRNELNNRRSGDEVVRTIPHGKPYMPRTFPKGTWTVYKPVRRESAYLAPFFIPTNATQPVEVWSLDGDYYAKPTGVSVLDEGYGLHFSTSNTTLGCIRINKKTDLEELVSVIDLCFTNKEVVTLEVV